MGALQNMSGHNTKVAGLIDLISVHQEDGSLSNECLIETLVKALGMCKCT